MVVTLWLCSVQQAQQRLTQQRILYGKTLLSSKNRKVFWKKFTNNILKDIAGKLPHCEVCRLDLCSVGVLLTATVRV